MHNFGRGMWRRVGDYEKHNSYYNTQLQHYLAFIEYQKLKQRQDAVNFYRENTLKSVNSQSFNQPELKEDTTLEETDTTLKETNTIIIAVETDIPSEDIVEEQHLSKEVMDNSIIIDIDKEKCKSSKKGKKHKK